MKKVGWPGKGWKFSCHRCGFWFPSTEIKKEWTGLLVCEACWEPRHPQTLIKVHGEKAFPDIVSKDGTDTFIAGRTCDVATSSGYADLGTADCMRAAWQTLPYTLLRDMFTNGHDSTGCACCDDGNSACVTPSPSFTYIIDTENPYTVHFTNTTYIPPPFCATTFLWDFGDGTTSSSSGDGTTSISSTVTHTFESGTFSVVLTAENDAGSGSITESLTFAPSYATELFIDFDSITIANAAAAGVTFNSPFALWNDWTGDTVYIFESPNGGNAGGIHTYFTPTSTLVINIDTSLLRVRNLSGQSQYTSSDNVRVYTEGGGVTYLERDITSIGPYHGWSNGPIVTASALTTNGYPTQYITRIEFDLTPGSYLFMDALHFF